MQRKPIQRKPIQHKIILGSGYLERDSVYKNLIDSIIDCESELWIWTDHDITPKALNNLNQFAKVFKKKLKVKILSNQSIDISKDYVDLHQEAVSIECLLDGLDLDKSISAKVIDFLKTQPHQDIFTNHSTRSDILRCLILFKYGGLYVDTDEVVKEGDLSTIVNAVNETNVSAPQGGSDVIYVGGPGRGFIKAAAIKSIETLLAAGYDAFKETRLTDKPSFTIRTLRIDSSRTLHAIMVGPGSLWCNQSHGAPGSFEWEHHFANSWIASSVDKIRSNRDKFTKEDSVESLDDTFNKMKLTGHEPYNLYKFIYMLMVISNEAFTYQEAEEKVKRTAENFGITNIRAVDSMQGIPNNELYGYCKYLNLILSDDDITIDKSNRETLESLINSLNREIVARVIAAYRYSEEPESRGSEYLRRRSEYHYIFIKALKHAEESNSAEIIQGVGLADAIELDHHRNLNFIFTLDDALWGSLLCCPNSWLKGKLSEKIYFRVDKNGVIKNSSSSKSISNLREDMIKTKSQSASEGALPGRGI